jgi:hypothetical protein
METDCDVETISRMQAEQLIKSQGMIKALEYVVFILSPEFGLEKEATKQFWKEALQFIRLRMKNEYCFLETGPIVVKYYLRTFADIKINAKIGSGKICHCCLYMLLPGVRDNHTGALAVYLNSFRRDALLKLIIHKPVTIKCT